MPKTVCMLQYTYIPLCDQNNSYRYNMVYKPSPNKYLHKCITVAFCTHIAVAKRDNVEKRQGNAFVSFF